MWSSDCYKIQNHMLNEYATEKEEEMEYNKEDKASPKLAQLSYLISLMS